MSHDASTTPTLGALRAVRQEGVSLVGPCPLGCSGDAPETAIAEGRAAVLEPPLSGDSCGEASKGQPSQASSLITLAGGATFVINPISDEITIIGIDLPAVTIALAAVSDADLISLANRFRAIALRGAS